MGQEDLFFYFFIFAFLLMWPTTFFHEASGILLFFSRLLVLPKYTLPTHKCLLPGQHFDFHAFLKTVQRPKPLYDVKLVNKLLKNVSCTNIDRNENCQLCNVHASLVGTYRSIYSLSKTQTLEIL